MNKQPVFVAFRTEAGTACVARFTRRELAKAFIRLGRYRWEGLIRSGTVFGPICNSREEAREVFDLTMVKGDFDQRWLRE